MAKAPAEQVNGQDIYKSLILAYKANIGEISNNITKIWNSDNINLDVIKWLCMENNFTIDFAKTLYMPKRPEKVNEVIASYIKAKVPHFFIHAKDKDIHNVEGLNDSTVNKLEQIIPNKPIQFIRVAGKLKYKMLMKNKKVEIDQEIINLYEKVNKLKKHSINNKYDLDSKDISYFYRDIKNQFLEINCNIHFVVDVLVKYLYSVKNSKRKSTLWNTFGDILLEHLESNLKDTKQCESCGKRIIITNNKIKYCEDCAKKINIKKTMDNKRKKFEIEK
jgi:hypothetical protein